MRFVCPPNNGSLNPSDLPPQTDSQSNQPFLQKFTVITNGRRDRLKTELGPVRTGRIFYSATQPKNTRSSTMSRTGDWWWYCAWDWAQYDGML